MEKGVIEVMDKQKNKAIIDTVSSIMQSSNQKTTLRCIQKDEEIQPDPWRMFIQKTSDLREYLWTTDEISNKEDCYCCWHIESFSPNWVAAKKKRCHKITAAERYQFVSNSNQYHHSPLQKSSFGEISSPFLSGPTIKHRLGKKNGTGESNIYRDIYVNNLKTEVNNKEEVIRTYETNKSKLKEILMKLRK